MARRFRSLLVPSGPGVVAELSADDLRELLARMDAVTVAQQALADEQVRCAACELALRERYSLRPGDRIDRSSGQVTRGG